MSGKSTDLTNKTFGKLKVVKRAENSSSGQPRWLCECRCGKTCIVDGRFLKNGAVKSCGCLPRGVPQGEMPERAMAQPSVSLGRLRKATMTLGAIWRMLLLQLQRMIIVQHFVMKTRDC